MKEPVIFYSSQDSELAMFLDQKRIKVTPHRCFHNRNCAADELSGVIMVP